MPTFPLTVGAPVKTALVSLAVRDATFQVPLEALRELARGIGDNAYATVVSDGDRVYVALSAHSGLRFAMSRAEFAVLLAQVRTRVDEAEALLATS